ncbi:hypothetical protein LguiB_024850 [Lonicera macranthoides]
MADSCSEQRRKRKYLLKSPPEASPRFFSLRSVFSCFTFLIFLYLFSYRLPFTHSSFRPPPLVIPSTLSLLSSSPLQPPSNFFSPFRIDDRVLFPDHVFLFLSTRINKILDFECVYTSNSDEIAAVKRDVLSVEYYNQFQFIVRCPLPPINYSTAVDLRRKGSRFLTKLVDGNGLRRINQTVHSWENVVYEAALDGDTAVVFAKGLNLRHEKESNPTQFSCHFGLGNWEKNGSFVLTTKAITAAQEVVRCPLPRSISKNPEKAHGIRVTIGVTPHARPAHGQVQQVLVPSVAKIVNSKSEVGERNKSKYELCVCTMVWNQASSLREWVMYHAWLGVERWFIYDNNSDDKINEVIDELELENYNVSSHLWPWIKTQEAGFSHCALRARDECNWISFMDVDEFFYFPVPTSQHKRFTELGLPGKNSLKEVVANLSLSPSIGEIRTACHSFGPSGLSSPPSQGVTAGYTCRLQSPERHKSIIRPDALDATLLNVVHHFHLRKGFESMNLHQGIAVINHYKYQVWEAFRAKFYRRVATYVADWQQNQNEGSKDRAPGLGTEAIEPPNWRLQFCEVWDTGLRDFVLANLADPETGSKRQGRPMLASLDDKDQQLLNKERIGINGID